MRVRCVDATEAGNPLVKGETYTVSGHIDEVPDWGGPKRKGYYLKETPGRFMATRFAVVEDEA